MFADQPADESRLKVAAIERPRRQQGVGKHLPQIPAEPDPERYTETLFAAIENLARQQRRRDFLQDVLAAAVLDFERRRQRKRKLHDLVVEERNA